MSILVHAAFWRRRRPLVRIGSLPGGAPLVVVPRGGVLEVGQAAGRPAATRAETAALGPAGPPAVVVVANLAAQRLGPAASPAPLSALGAASRTVEHHLDTPFIV